MPSEEVKLGKHEGKTVAGVGLIIRGTGDGLSQAMELDPVILKHGDRVGIYIEGDVVDLHFPGVKGTNSVRRVAVVNADAGYIVEDRSEMAEILREQADRAQRKAEAEAGVGQFFDKDGNVIGPEHPDHPDYIAGPEDGE